VAPLVVLVVPHLPPHVADRSVRARVSDADADADEEEAGKVPEAARWVRERSAGAVEVAGAGRRRRDGRCGTVAQWSWSNMLGEG
jgi:hypothetical protein